ncbi:hypothetical protein [Chryseobacterium sp. JUb7]|uniref:hypothetical protein n=1 Tax=Chryseobacterium sp. JUb7 TaxID=2940599 RepID=UPI00216996D1|nr:hypothetical protein [Chryseobacterium sp. JUb7]MCS3529519.1 archaellin [Chryseobacterium sp. JUb7]
MKNLFLFFLTFLCIDLSAQQISYIVPENYKNEFNSKNYKAIIDRALLEISHHEKVTSLEDGIIKTESGFQMGLDNLLYKCKSENDVNVLNNIVKEHVDNLFSSMDLSKSLDLKQFDKVKQYLSIRIYPKEYFEQYIKPENSVYKIDLEGTYTVLMLDLPTAFTNVQRGTMFKFWNKSEQEVFSLAQKNINSQKVNKLTQEFDLGGTKIEVSFIDDETYAGSYALDLINNSKDFVGELGSVVAFPNKGIINICKITKEKPLDFVKFIQGTKGLVQKFHDEHPYPISTDFFWYYNGKFKKIDVNQDIDGKINVISPLELSKLLLKLKT